MATARTVFDEIVEPKIKKDCGEVAGAVCLICNLDLELPIFPMFTQYKPPI